MTRIEMKVDDIKRSEKGLDTCVLVGANEEPMIDGEDVTPKFTLQADSTDLFDKIGIGRRGLLIDIEFREPAQQQLG
jgi:hypothetical protein